MSLPERVNFPQQEEEVLALWKRLDAFKTSLALSRGKPEYTVRRAASERQPAGGGAPSFHSSR
jgi:hypothetical protein